MNTIQIHVQLYVRGVGGSWRVRGNVAQIMPSYSREQVTVYVVLDSRHHHLNWMALCAQHETSDLI